MDVKAPKHGKPHDRGWYLKYATAESFGAMSQTTLGPLSPGLNIVHGANEAGKTTYANLIGGVMFGWEDGRSSRNTYKPAAAERSGSLVFGRDGRDASAIAHLSRVRNADGLQGDRWLLGDIDQETYREIFSLNSDQLRSMGDASQITSRLLTASAGTASSPAQVRSALEARIAEYTSRSAKYPHSIKRLVAELDELEELISAARKEADSLARDEAELVALRGAKLRLQDRMRDTNAKIERMTSSLTTVESIEARICELQNEIEALDVVSNSAAALEEDEDVPQRLLRISRTEHVALVERIDVLAEEEAAVMEALDEARRDYEESLREYENMFAAARLEDSRKAVAAKSQKGTFVLIVLFAVVAVAFAAMGMYMAFEGGEEALVPMAGLFSGALLFAIASVVSAIWGLSRVFRANDKSELDEAEWLMRKKRDHCEKVQASWDELKRSISGQLDAMGCACAEGNLHVARALLEGAQQARQRIADMERTRDAIEARRAALQQEIELNRRMRGERMEECGLDAESGIVDLDVALSVEEDNRERLAQESEELSRKVGQLEQRLEASREKRDLDDLRMQHQQVLTRIRESERGLAEALLALREVDLAVDEWKSSSQPEVHRAAERLFYRMTRGRWRHVEFDENEQIVVSDDMGVRRSPLLLSTGTVQQLYLAMRIALLDTAEFVGRNVPVVCDDILVNFDEKRRKAAARALADLARRRQVIIFTCHKDVVMSLRTVDLSANVIEL